VQKKYTAVLKEFDTEEKGLFAYARTTDGLALIRKEITSPSPTIAIINRDQGLIYYPKIKQAQRLRLGQYKDKAEFLAVGVGQSAGRMKENFAIRLVGHEAVNGIPCTVLELKPKSEKTAAFLSVITLWFDEQRWVPIQSRMQEPNEDYLLTRFSDIKLNTKLPESLFSMKLPSGVEIVGE
jgi:outer membrane lipoprotein-sorting protein